MEEDVRVVSERRVNERFGHAVLHTETADVYVLDLYTRQELVFEGFHMPPLGYASDALEGDEPRRGLVHIVMSLDGEVVQKGSVHRGAGVRDRRCLVRASQLLHRTQAGERGLAT